MTLIESLNKGGYLTFLKILASSGFFKIDLSTTISDVDVGETLKPIGAFHTLGAEVLSIQMEVEDNALDQFEIHYKYSEDGDYIKRVSVAGDFTTPNAPVLSASGSWLTAAVANTHWLKLDVAGIYAVQLWAASGNAAGSEIILNGSAK